MYRTLFYDVFFDPPGRAAWNSLPQQQVVCFTPGRGLFMPPAIGGI